MVPPAAVDLAGMDLRYAGEAVFLLGLAWGIMKWLKRTIFEIDEPSDPLDVPTTLGEYPAQARPKRKPRPTPPVPRASSGKPAAPLTPADWARLGISNAQLAAMTPRELEFFLATVNDSRAAKPDGAAREMPDAPAENDEPDPTPGAAPPPLR